MTTYSTTYHDNLVAANRYLYARPETVKAPDALNRLRVMFDLSPVQAEDVLDTFKRLNPESVTI